MNLFFHIFYHQNKMNAHDKAQTMLEDFAIKCIQKNLPKDDIISHLGEYYSQCKEVATANYERAVEYLK